MGCNASGQVHTMESNGVSPGFEEPSKTSKLKVPLTEREVLSLTKSWRDISDNMVNAGITMFLKMFEDRQDVKAMFEQFRTVDNVSDLYSNSSLENHALIVMNAIDESMSNMDDEEFLVNFLVTTGKSHHRFENFSASVFWAIEEPFILAVKQTLGDKFTQTMERIYRRAIRFILTTLISGFNQPINEM